jgi:hypothetical protein
MVERISTDGWDPVKAAEMNQLFHEMILRTVGNRRLLEIWRSLEIHQQIARVNSQSLSTPPEVVLHITGPSSKRWRQEMRSGRERQCVSTLCILRTLSLQSLSNPPDPSDSQPPN